MDLHNIRTQQVSELSDKFCGTDPDGKKLAVTSYYITLDREPFFCISGECHYSRVSENQWEDAILRMKMGGINIVSTYCFWNHHEEVEGRFRFDGNRNLRRFVQLCQKHGMYVIVRIGPFAHGEVRNGGLPDWLYGKPYEVRSLNEGFLSASRRLYRQYALQLEGLFYKDGGPVIAAQIENEYMHSAAPWEMTTGTANEWTPGGEDGAEYMRTLKKIAMEEGIRTPFYTCTGWGGAAAALDEMIPLWGGYAFWPWIFYDYRGEHPMTPEYLYRDYHNNEVPKTYNFEPVYPPEEFPYACCEMGGGMSVFYHYRFQFPYPSIDAMANIKLAGGCNFLGYYMYRGGSNPKGEVTPYLNEFQCPKISYDYQAVLGEFGQVRDGYHRLRALHLFTKNFTRQLCNLVTVLPKESQGIEPSDCDTLRYAVRTDGKRGFLFLNNYQDHCVCKDKIQESIRLETQEDSILFEDISLKAEEEAILPFALDVDGGELLLATVQPLSVIEADGKSTYFFFVPAGMMPRYVWRKETVLGYDCSRMQKKEGFAVEDQGRNLTVIVPKDQCSSYEIETKKGQVQIVTLTREESLQFYEIEYQGQKTAVLCSAPFLYDDEKIRVESVSGQKVTELLTFPEILKISTGEWTENTGISTGNAQGTDTFVTDGIRRKTKSVFRGIELIWKTELITEKEVEVHQCGPSRYRFSVPKIPDFWKDGLLRIRYQGDIGNAFLDGVLVSDNFYNGAIWEIGLKEVGSLEPDREMVVYITPKKTDVYVDVSSVMAGRKEQLNQSLAVLEHVTLLPVCEVCFSV